MLKESGIQEFVTKKGWNYSENSSIVGVTMPSKLAYLMGPAGTLTMRYMTLHFGVDGIVVMPLNNMTGNIEESSSFIIPTDSIKHVEFKKKLLSYQLVVLGDEFELNCKVNKVMVGAAWHKAGLANLLERY